MKIENLYIKFLKLNELGYVFKYECARASELLSIEEIAKITGENNEFESQVVGLNVKDTRHTTCITSLYWESVEKIFSREFTMTDREQVGESWDKVQ